MLFFKSTYCCERDPQNEPCNAQFEFSRDFTSSGHQMKNQKASVKDPENV